jgi:hypothetical protein
LTNPTHPFWQHFETFYVQSQPVYISIYPPAQGLAMALGQRLGHPWIGILLLGGAMAASLVWMLRAWFPPLWAFIGGLVPSLHILSGYWMNSYWGGSLAAIGGALVVGALGRVWRHRRMTVADGLWLGLGFAILANRRPMEGAVLAISAIPVFVYWLLRRAERPLGRSTASGAGMCAAILVLTALSMGYYDWRGTGNPLLMPYQVGADKGMVHHLIWQKPSPPKPYRFEVMRKYCADEVQGYWDRRSQYLRTTVSAALQTARSDFSLPFLIPLVFLPFAIRRRSRFIPLLPLALAGVALLWAETITSFHYFAPFLGVWLVFAIQAFRWLETYRRHRIGTLLQGSIITASLLGTTIWTVFTVFVSPYPTWDRPKMAATLDSIPGRHLVMVQYDPAHDPHYEWVYNRADIDNARVVWARPMDHESDCRLFAYFHQRKLWRAEVNSTSGHLSAASPESFGCDVNSASAH